MRVVPSSTPIKAPTISSTDEERAAAFRAWVFEWGGKASREPHAFINQLPDARLRVTGGDAPHGTVELHLAALDLAEAVAQHRLANYRAVEPCAARDTPNTSLARELHTFSATCLMQIGNACHGRARLADALRAYHSARERYALLGERKGESTVLRNMSLCYQLGGLKHLAVEAGLQAHAIAVTLGDEFDIATHDNQLGALYGELREFDAARLCLERAQISFAKSGRGDFELQTILQLALLARDEGRLDVAFAWLDRAAAVSARIMRRELEADRLLSLARVLRSAGRDGEARPKLEVALGLATEVEDRDRVAEVQLELGAIAICERRAADARTAGEAALAAARTNGTDHRDVPDALGLLADAARLVGDWERAWIFERERHETISRIQTLAEDSRARSLAVRHQLDVIREEAERRRLETVRLEEALAEVAARLDENERTPRVLPNPDRISADNFLPLGLRPRECEVLLWVVRGKSNDEIGTILGCSAETVKSHLKRIYLHLDVTNRTAAAASALSTLSPTSITRAPAKAQGAA